ncbi:MAG: MFS transporter [Stenotrophomonas sp.]|uniref:MFS transporter n=1 Tax=Stenotrophomonas sp. TaxID=69392 RepID=UPI003D6C8181
MKPLRPIPQWEDHEKPTLPGGASMPWHPPGRRAAYAAVALLVAITGGLGNALITANLPWITGQMGLQATEASWLVAAYMMVNVSANLLVFKFRQEYGLLLFAEIGLGVYAVLAVLHLFVGSLATTVLVRAGSGFAGAACSTLSVLYMLQAMPRKYVGQMLMIGMSLSMLATPLAWLLSPSLLNYGEWQNLYLFEAGLALCSFAAVVVLKLPPGIQIKVFERTDFLTFALLAPALAMLVIVLNQGLLRWWFDTPWLGWLLAGALVLLTTGLCIEQQRRNPLLQVRWLMGSTMLRFIIGAFLIRFLTSEQNYGMVNMMRTLGMGPDQMAPLYAVILCGVVAGIAISALTFGPKALLPQLAASIILLGSAAFLDQHRTSLDRPMDFALSQFLAATGSGMFMGPLMLMGMQRALARGLDHIVSFVVILSLTQNFAGLAGSALLGSYQLHREHVYSSELISHTSAADPLVAQRLQQQQQAYARLITDPVQLKAQGTAALAAAAKREANVRAFNDVFALSGWIAIGFLSWLLLVVTLRDPRVRKFLRPEQAAPSSNRGSR